MARFRRVFLLATLIFCLTVGVTVAAAQRYTIPGDNVFPEGIASNTASGEFYVGSTTTGNVYRGTVASPNLELFLPGGADGRTDVRGLKVGNGRLYLAGGPTAQLFVYEVSSKKLLAKFATGLTPSFVNDVTIAPNGDAYFTDSNSPAIYRVAADVTAANAFSRWIDLTGSPIVYGMGFNLNGIAASADGKYLVTVQSNTGKLFRIDIATKAVAEIATGGEPLTGGDGVLIDGQTLWVMRNAAATLVTLRLSPDFASATIVSTDKDPEFDFPTTFARVEGNLLVVNSQLNKRASNTPPVLPFVILGIPAPGYTPAPSPSPSPSATPRPSPTPTASPAPVPSPPPTGSGGNLPGLPNTGVGGAADNISPAAYLGVGLVVLLGLSGGLTLHLRRVRARR